jgi:tetratricopeptide (TPR) repeat protein
MTFKSLPGRKKQTTTPVTWFYKSGVLMVTYPRPRPAHDTVESNDWLEPADRDRLLRQRALHAAQVGDFKFALQSFNRLLERNPASAADYNNRGLVHFQCGQLASALADYNQAIRHDPYLANVYNNRANYYAALGELHLSVEDYEEAIRLDPMNVRAWINQGITFREMDLYDQALQNFEQALQINRHTDGMENQLLLECHIHAEQGRTNHLAGDWNYAITEYHQAIDLLNAQADMELPVPHYLRQQIEAWLQELTQMAMG